MDALWSKHPELLGGSQQPYPLLSHLLDTALAAETVWDEWLRPGLRNFIADRLTGGDHQLARQTLSLVAGLHDVGKANPQFQLQSALPGTRNWVTHQTRILKEHGLEPVHPATVRALAGRLWCDDTRQHANPARRHEFHTMLAMMEPAPANDHASHLHAIARKNARTSTRDWAAFVNGGHHGNWPSKESTMDSELFIPGIITPNWRATQEHVIAGVEQAVGLNTTDLPELVAEHFYPITVLMSGLVVLADWLASQSSVVNTGLALHAGGLSPTANPEGWMDAQREHVAHIVRTSVGSYQPRSEQDTMRALLGKHPMRTLQQMLHDDGDRDGLAIVAYPTGEGKTEAALLRHAHRDEGLIFALPTRATADAMHARLQKVFAGSTFDVIVSHQFAQTTCQDDFFTNGIKRLLAPVSVSTVDQVLMGSLSQKHLPLRLLAIANHHVVVDEVHTFDQYQSGLLTELLSWMGLVGGRVTLLSATLPAWQQDKFERAYRNGLERVTVTQTHRGDTVYPTLRYVSGEGDQSARTSEPSRRSTLHFDVRRANSTVDVHEQWVVDKATGYPTANIAAVVNTVNRAVELAGRLRAALPGRDIICLHSRMTQAHRTEVETKLKERLGPSSNFTEPLIVVGTSVIEASLDVDFDFMSSDNAPAPSLVQRAGRLWRFRDSEERSYSEGRVQRMAGVHPCTLMVVHPVTKEGKTAAVASLPYTDTELSRVADYLDRSPVLHVPDGVQQFVDDTAFVYDEADEMTLGKEGHQAHARIESLNASRAPIDEVVVRLDRGGRRRPSVIVDLHALTLRSDAEEAMSTRYIDRPAGTYLLVDVSDDSQWFSHMNVRQLNTAGADEVAGQQFFSVPASGKVNDKLAAAHEDTMQVAGVGVMEGGRLVWQPHASMLRGLLPVDVSLLARHGLMYGPDGVVEM